MPEAHSAVSTFTQGHQRAALSVRPKPPHTETPGVHPVPGIPPEVSVRKENVIRSGLTRSLFLKSLNSPNVSIIGEVGNNIMYIKKTHDCRINIGVFYCFT